VSWLLQLINEFKPYFELLNATSATLSIITWLAAFPLLIRALRRSKLASIRLPFMELRFAEAAAAMGAALESKSMPFQASALARTLDAAITGQRLAGKSILWVDDNPTSHRYESMALTALGISVTDALDTEPALQQISGGKYDLIISDMGRASGKDAGYVLLQALRKVGNSTPFVIYSTSNAPKHKQEALRSGAQGSTNDPQELLELVVKILTGAKK